MIGVLAEQLNGELQNMGDTGLPETWPGPERNDVREMGMRTLIVDDSSFIREYLRQLLQRMGIVCDEAVNGKDALSLLEKSELFDLMLLDVNMPIMGGLDCVKALRQADLHPTMKVMMVTTEADDHFIDRAFEYGADEFLMKPFTPQSLREKLLLLGFVSA